MELILDAVIAFFAALGIISLGWLLLGRLLSPFSQHRGVKLLMVVRAQGDNAELCEVINGLIWFKNNRCADMDIYISDEGMDEETLNTVSRLTDGGEIRMCMKL